MIGWKIIELKRSTLLSVYAGFKGANVIPLKNVPHIAIIRFG